MQKPGVALDGIGDPFLLFRQMRFVRQSQIALHLHAGGMHVEVDKVGGRDQAHFPVEELEEHQLHLQEVGSCVSARAVVTASTRWSEKGFGIPCYFCWVSLNMHL